MYNVLPQASFPDNAVLRWSDIGGGGQCDSACGLIWENYDILARFTFSLMSLLP